VSSSSISASFCTLPLKPTNLTCEEGASTVRWTPSAAPSVSHYRVRWRADNVDGFKEEVTSSNELTLTDLSSTAGIYRVNVYAAATTEDDDGQHHVVESKELHGKFAFNGETLSPYVEDM